MTSKSSTANPTLSGIKSGIKSNLDLANKVETNSIKLKKLITDASGSKPQLKETKLSVLKEFWGTKNLMLTLSINSSTSFLLINATDSMKLLSLLTTTQEKLLMFLEPVLTTEKDWFNGKRIRDLTKDGDGLTMEETTSSKASSMVNASILLKRRKTLNPKLSNGTRPEDLTNAGKQFLKVKDYTKSNLAMHTVNISRFITMISITEESCKSIVKDHRPCGELKDTFLIEMIHIPKCIY